MGLDIPIGQAFVVLPPDPDDSAQQADAALAALQAGHINAAACHEQLTTLAARHPTSLTTWAALGELALPEEVITAYAFFRTGYHRGLDRARASGWRGTQHLRWEHETNRGFLRCLYGLMRTAEAIGEEAEAMRTRAFLLEMDPADHFGLTRA